MSIQLQRRIANPNLSLPDSIHPLLRQIYSQRSLNSSEDLQLGLANLIPPNQLHGMDEAVALLTIALTEQQRILIVSDFDADGATSCALVMNALHQFGAEHVDYIVPNRFDYGYGLTPEIVELAQTKTPDLIITVDNGISSVDGVSAANAAGIKVLITDHHLPAEQTPAAAAIVNPNQLACSFPSKCIAGVGVIFYTMLALRAALRNSGWFQQGDMQEPNLADQLDLVALGTVADVVALDRNNRILVDEGLKRIRGGRTRPGVSALLKIANRNPTGLTATDLGFAIGPRLNAAGRLDDMSTGIECLLSTNESDAYSLAMQLDAMNKDRKQIEVAMREQAFKNLNELNIEAANIPAALSIFDSRWHQGVVGILASRVKDKYHRPVIAFAEVADSDPIELKGSGRSIKGFHIRDALDSVASKNPGLISKFGGHAMAAGLSLEKDKFENFTKAFTKEAERLLSQDQLQALLLSDGEVDHSYFSLEIANLLEQGGPWGQEFPEPTFDGRFNLVNFRRVGEHHLKMVLSPLQSPQQAVDAIAFNIDEENWPADNATEVHLAYRMSVNEFRGNRSLQLMVEKILEFV